MNNNSLSQDKLKQYVEYAPDTGILRAKCNANNGRYKAGDIVGWLRGSIRNSKSNQYLVFHIDRKSYPVHKLAYLYTYGYMPEIVDHVNGNTLDNRIINLREATVSNNSWNSCKPITNTSGVKGLYIRKDGLQVRVMKGERSYTKFFSVASYGGDTELTKLAAIAYLQDLRLKLHGEFANHG